LEIDSQRAVEQELIQEFLFGLENGKRRPPADGKTELV
jgi:hypothetical protein